MLNEEFILTALTGVRDGYVEETRQALGYETIYRRNGRAPWIILLAAAVVISLLTVTAYAAGWFGLSSRLTPTENSYIGKEALRFSVNDYAGTPTAEASREWTEYRDHYVSTHAFTNDNSFMDSLNEPEKSYCAIYGAFDREMLDRLTEISGSSGVKLHTKMYAAPDYEDGLRALGIDDFIRGEADRSFKYIFEDGSFTVETYMELDDDTEIIFTLIRGAKGVMENGYFVLDGTNVYDEWEYVTEAGMNVNIAVNKWNELTKTVPVYILFDAGDYLVTVQTECPNKEDVRAEAEKLAERFDYAELSGEASDVSIPEKLEPESAEPHPVKPKAGLMTVKEFFETDEYKASVAFQRAYSEYFSAKIKMNEGAYMDFYYGAFPAKDEKVNEILENVLAEYPDLAVPREALGLFSNCPIEADRIMSYCSFFGDGIPTPMYVYEPADREEIFNMLGMEPFEEGELYTATAYDTGAFWLACSKKEYSIYYIPKGSFFPALRFAIDENGEGWAYETACGEQVSAAFGGSFRIPASTSHYALYETDTWRTQDDWIYQSAYNYALYETDTAYVFLEFPERLGAAGMEELLDGIDFTKFNSQKPWGAEREIVPKYIDYAPLTIMKSDFWSKDEFLIVLADTEAYYWTYDALMGKDTEGITWEISDSASVTLTDNGDGSCTLVTHGTSREAIELTARRGEDSYTAVIICENR